VRGQLFSKERILSSLLSRRWKHSLFDEPAMSQKIASVGDGQREIDLLLHNEEGESFDSFL